MLVRVGNGEELALVLSGGGARAAYQVGVLAAMAERAGDDLRFPIVTGVSAGAINAGWLASDASGSITSAIERLERSWLALSTERVFRAGPLALALGSLRFLCMVVAGGSTRGVLARGLLDTRPLRETLARHLHTGDIAANLRSGRLRALALSSTSYATGRSVTFVQDGQDTPLWSRAGRSALRAPITVDHVMASCALPLLFPAIELEEEHYGDGSLRHMAPLSPAIHLGAESLIAISVRHRRPGDDPAVRPPRGYPAPAQILGMLFNAVFLDALDSDAERLERINRSTAALPPQAREAVGLRPIRLLVLRPSRDLGRMTAGLARNLPPGLRAIVRGLGGTGGESPDLLSYLLFERPYVERLIELGRDDTLEQWPQIEPLLAEAARSC